MKKVTLHTQSEAGPFAGIGGDDGHAGLLAVIHVIELKRNNIRS